MTSSEFLSLDNSEGLKAETETALRTYLDGVRNNGLVDRVILGVDHEGGKGLVFNVLKQDVSLSDMVDPKYSALTRLGGVLEKTLTFQRIRNMGFVNPSNVDKLLGECKERSIDTTIIDIPKTS